jgi:hypothetical protein
VEPFDPLSQKPPPFANWGINFGGGTNSTALVIECFNRGLKPGWILFSDTGDEWPETYQAMDRLDRWLQDRGRAPISRTKWTRTRPTSDGSMTETLEEYCLRTGYMPSAAYGYAGCSTKFKRQPAEKWRQDNGYVTTIYALGFDAGEHRRVARPRCEGKDLPSEQPWYPLYAWGITRARCEEIIQEAGLPPVPKSSCFYCPHTKTVEWNRLRVQHPDLFARALHIEANAEKNGNAKSGLRRASGFLRNLPMAPATEAESRTPCDCFESEDD